MARSMPMDSDEPTQDAPSAGTVYFSGDTARVTDRALTVGGHSYDLRDIDLVHVREMHDPRRRRAWLLLSLVAGVAWAIMYVILFIPLGDARILVAVVVPLIWLLATMQWGTAGTYVLVLETRSGPVDAYTSRSGRQVRELYRAVDEAIRRHGDA